MDNNTLEKVYSDITADIPQKKESKGYGIAFVAGIGYGKTTVSKILAQKLDLYIASNDFIRRTIEKYVFDESNEPSREVVNNLAYKRLEQVIENNIPVVIDANGKLRFYELQDIFKKHNTKLYWIKLECSDKEARRRILKRNEQLDYTEYSRATILTYEMEEQRLMKYNFPEEYIDFVIDTQKDIYAQIDKIVEIIQKKNK